MPRSSSSSRSGGGGGFFGGGRSSAPAPARAAAPAPAHHAPAPAHHASAPHAAAPAHHAPAPAAAPAYHPPAAPAPAFHPPAPVAAPSGGGGGFLGTMMSGLAFGTGSAVAHRAVGAVADSMFGGKEEKKEAAPAPAAAAPAPVAPAPAAVNSGGARPCEDLQAELSRCLAANRTDLSACQMWSDNLDQCQRDVRSSARMY